MSRTRIFIISILVSFLCLSGGAIALRYDKPVTIQWPSRGYPTIQDALDLLPAGGVLEIAAGEYFVDEPIYVYRDVMIRGAGLRLDFEKFRDKDCKEIKLDDTSDPAAFVDKIRKDKKEPFTHLIGPPPQPLNEDNLPIPAQDTEGMFNVIGANVVFRDMEISGFDAGIVTRGDGSERLISAYITNIHISDTGRGILSLKSGDVTVANTLIQDALWNGISRVADPIRTTKFVLYLSMIINTENVGLFFKDEEVSLHDVWIFNCKEGGILAYNCQGTIEDCLFLFNNFASIALYQCPWFYILNNKISSTRPSPANGSWGDGITQTLSSTIVSDNLITNSDRAGLSNFGGFAGLGNNRIVCSAFDVEGEPCMGQNFKFEDYGGNHCGCPVIPLVNNRCHAETVGMEPPEPIAPIE